MMIFHDIFNHIKFRICRSGFKSNWMDNSWWSSSRKGIIQIYAKKHMKKLNVQLEKNHVDLKIITMVMDLIIIQTKKIMNIFSNFYDDPQSLPDKKDK